MKALLSILPSQCSRIFSLGLSVAAGMAGENGCGGSVPEHRVDVLESPSLCSFTAPVPLPRAPFSSSVAGPP